MKIIAYGSLMNQKSLEKTLQRPTQLTKISVPGIRRTFNAPFDEYAFLNLELVEDSSIEAAYFELRADEVNKFSLREKGSDLVEVCPDFYAFVWPAANCRELPVLQSYIDVCQTGGQQLGINLWQGTKQPRHIIDDSGSPLYS